jgi:hypothetical protein
MPHYYQTSARKENSEQHVFIAIPTYGDIKAGCVDALNKVQHDLLAHRVSVDVAILAGNCHVDDARNDLCRMFLESECTHLMFIDADLQFSANSVRTLLGHDVDIVGGVYQFKNDDLGFPLNLDKFEYDDKGLVPVKGLPGGFMCIKRKVIERLYKKAADKGAWPNKGNYGTIPVTEIFHRTVEMGKSRRSGDYEFCRKVTKAGFGLFMDATLNFGHIGDKIWTGENVGIYHLRKLGVVDLMAKDEIHSLNGEPEKFQKVCKAYGNEPWAIDHVLLGVLWFQMKGLGDDATFLETGTGVSTAMFCAEGWKGASLEHSKMWRGFTEDFLDRMEINENSIIHSPIGEDGWYEYRQHDFQPDLVFIDGPVRKVGGERAGILTHCSDMVRNARALVVDDVDDGDGRKLLARIEDECGWTFQIIDGPRRKFAIGEKT